MDTKIIILILETLRSINYDIDGLKEPYQRRGYCFKEFDEKLRKEVDLLESKIQ